MKKDNLEFERKFLLVRKPLVRADSIYKIEQHYYDDVRIRRIRFDNDPHKDKFYHTIKRNIKPGVNFEDEKEIQRVEFYKYLQNSKSYIAKDRHNYYIGDLKWEIDVFRDINLIIAEVELPREDYKLEIPNFIKDLMVMEVTEFKDFSNKRLSRKVGGHY
jgi:CYTH domain-containing protein